MICVCIKANCTQRTAIGKMAVISNVYVLMPAATNIFVKLYATSSRSFLMVVLFKLNLGNAVRHCNVETQLELAIHDNFIIYLLVTNINKRTI